MPKTMSRAGSASTRCALALAVVTGCGLVAGCGDGGGFRPLYGSANVGGAQVTDRLAKVEFAPIPGRVGQRIRNEMIFHATGGGTAPPAEYRLDIAMTESVSDTIVKTDGNPLSRVYNLNATFTLIRIADKKVVLRGNSAARAAFERNKSVFANVRANEEAEDRAAKTVADELKSRLNAFLASPPA